MPMSPDDYKALRQLVTPVDMAAVVRPCTCNNWMSILTIPAEDSFPPLFLFSRCFQDDNVIGGFEAFDAQVDAD